MISLNEVKKSFEEVKAVDGITFSAVEGEVFGLLGPNGAGKSTTIKMIMNILAPDSGEILFDGKKLSEKYKNNIGYLPEERGLYKKVKVNDILLYFSSLKDYPKQKAQKNIDYWLERFDLMEWKHAKVSELSKGMSQKIQFITAVAHDPRIMFFDEPFSGLDPVSADALKESILDLGKLGKTILFSTHIMDHAEKLCTKIMIINKGKEVVSGSMEKIKNDHGKQSITLEFDGDGTFIKDLDYVNNVISYPRYVELELKSMDMAGKFLADSANRINIRRYETQTPSLHKIFINLVGKKENVNA